MARCTTFLYFADSGDHVRRALILAWLQEAMPAEAPGTLSKDETAAVVAYILKLNKIPAGKVDLSTDRAALDRIRITEAPAR